MQKDELARRVAGFGAEQPWNHNFQLPHGVETRPGTQTSHGKNHVKWARLQPLLSAMGLQGKRVLDMGCNEGFFSFQLADMGASVEGIDIDPHRVEKARFIGEALGRTDVRFRVMDIYSPEFAREPQFDACLCLGFLHRVPDPYTAMARLAARSNIIVFEWKALKFGPHDEPFAYFSPKPIDRADYYGTEYWLLSYAAVEGILGRLGFGRFHRVDDPTQRRAILVAGKADNAVFSTPDQVMRRGRVRSLASHTKRYIRTLAGVLSGRINA